MLMKLTHVVVARGYLESHMQDVMSSMCIYITNKMGMAPHTDVLFLNIGSLNLSIFEDLVSL